MESRAVSFESEACPCLTPVVNDRLWIVNTGAYCRRGDGRIRLPARVTLQTTCTTSAHLTCEGFSRSTAGAGA